MRKTRASRGKRKKRKVCVPRGGKVMCPRFPRPPATPFTEGWEGDDGDAGARSPGRKKQGYKRGKGARAKQLPKTKRRAAENGDDFSRWSN